MKYLIAVGATVVVLAVVAVAIALGHVPLLNADNTAIKDQCRQQDAPGLQDLPLRIVLAGVNTSDLANRKITEQHLEEVVLPEASTVGARVVVGTISANSSAEPDLVADLVLAATGDAADNPDNQAAAARKATDRIVSCTKTALDRAAATGHRTATDIFGAVSWANSLIPPETKDVKVIVLSDDVNTSRKACDFNQQPIDPSSYDRIFATCAQGDYERLASAEVWLGGIGLDDGDATTKQPSTEDLTALWTAFFARHGAKVTNAGATLLPGE